MWWRYFPILESLLRDPQFLLFHQNMSSHDDIYLSYEHISFCVSLPHKFSYTFFTFFNQRNQLHPFWNYQKCSEMIIWCSSNMFWRIRKTNKTWLWNKHLCKYACLFIHICVYMCTYICVYTYIHTHILICMATIRFEKLNILWNFSYAKPFDSSSCSVTGMPIFIYTKWFCIFIMPQKYMPMEQANRMKTVLLHFYSHQHLLFFILFDLALS